MQVRVIDNITKVYPDMIKVTIFKKPIYLVVSEHKKKRTQVSPDYVPSYTSVNRTVRTIKDIVLCNDFELFCTFTFNPEKVDRFNYGQCYHKMSAWLHNQKEVSRLQNKRFEYLVVPEKHKSGAWHFHALIKGYCGTKKDSHHKSASGRTIYNLTSYRSGFTTAVEIDNKEAVSRYISKYITKELVTTFNGRRFTCSKGILRPVRSVNSSIFSSTPPLFRRLIADNEDTALYNISPL